MKKINKMIAVCISLLFLINLVNTIGMSRLDNLNCIREAVWNVNMSFTEISGEYTYVIFGEASDANDGPPHDSYDIPLPPSPPYTPFIRAWFDDNLGNISNPSDPYHKLIRDFRYYPDINKTWNLTVVWVNDSGIGTNITITWDINDFDNCEYSSVILSRKNQITGDWFDVLDMLNENSFSYTHYKIWIDPPGIWFWYLQDEFKINANYESENIPPIAHDDYYETDEDTTISQVAPGVLDNDIDNDGPETLIATLDTNVSHGDLILNSDGSFEYTPDSDWSGLDYFTYHAFDGEDDSNIATVEINISPQNDNPVANDDSIAVEQYSSNNQINVLYNDYDVDGDDLEIIDVTTPSHGTTSYDGSYVYYTPDEYYSGPDHFYYTITDNNGSNGVIATVHITVIENEPPEKPDRPSGETQGHVGVEYAYSSTTTDPNDNLIYYYFSWGDGMTSGWIGPYISGETVTANHTWTKRGSYEIKVKAMDEHGLVSEWSDTLPISMPHSKNTIQQNKIFSFLLFLFERLLDNINIFQIFF